MHAVQSFFGFALLIVAILGSFAWQNSRSITMINDWAQQNGFTVLSAHRRYFRVGPFFFRATRQQTIYYVTLQDQQNQIRTAFIRCGSWWFGLVSKDVKVEWEG